jgi:hypothetical protein
MELKKHRMIRPAARRADGKGRDRPLRAVAAWNPMRRCTEPERAARARHIALAQTQRAGRQLALIRRLPNKKESVP